VPVLAFNWINLVQQAMGLSLNQPNVFLLPGDRFLILAPGHGGKHRSTGKFSIDPGLLLAALQRLHG